MNDVVNNTNNNCNNTMKKVDVDTTLLKLKSTDVNHNSDINFTDQTSGIEKTNNSPYNINMNQRPTLNYNYPRPPLINEHSNVPPLLPSRNQNPINIYNNIPEPKIKDKSKTNVQYIIASIILISGCITCNPLLLMTTLCINTKDYESEHHKNVTKLSAILGCMLGIVWLLFIALYLVLILLPSDSQ